MLKQNPDLLILEFLGEHHLAVTLLDSNNAHIIAVHRDLLIAELGLISIGDQSHVSSANSTLALSHDWVTEWNLKK